MKRIAVLGLISFMSLILSGCGPKECSPQIIKVPQKVAIQTPRYPNIINPKEWCDRNESECIVGIAAYNYVEAVEFAAKYHIEVEAKR